MNELQQAKEPVLVVCPFCGYTDLTDNPSRPACGVCSELSEPRRNLVRALREVANTFRSEERQTDDLDHVSDKLAESARTMEHLTRALAFVVRTTSISPKQVYEAIGAPGDFGYGTDLGDALAAFYSARE